MKVEKVSINGFSLWIIIDENRTFDFATNQPIIKGYFCYYNFKDPNILFYGERFKNQDGQPIIFETETEAMEYVYNLLGQK